MLAPGLDAFGAVDPETGRAPLTWAKDAHLWLPAPLGSCHSAFGSLAWGPSQYLRRRPTGTTVPFAKATAKANHKHVYLAERK